MSSARARRTARNLRLGALAALAILAAGAQAQPTPAAPADKAFDAAGLLREVESAVSLAGGLKLRASRPDLIEGEAVVFTVDLPHAGFLNLISIDPSGDAVVLFPNPYQSDNKVEPGPFNLPNERMPFEVRAGAPFGELRVAAFLTTEPLDLQTLGGTSHGGNAAGNALTRFVDLTLAARDLINQFAGRKLLAGSKQSPLLAGMAIVTTCAKPGPCAATGVADGTVRRIIDAFVPGIFFDQDADLPKSMPATLRRLDERGLSLTKASEGFVRQLYLDAAGHCTIAYGHLLRLGGCQAEQRSRYPRGISEPGGSTLLMTDLSRAQAAVQSLVSAPLTDAQFAALVDFTFNVGIGNLKRSTLLKAVNAHQHERVPFQLRRWTRAGGRELRGLVNRREREVTLYFEGKAIPKTVPKDEVVTPIDIRQGEAQ